MDNQEDTYDVVYNQEEQYSIWPSALNLPEGWTSASFTGSKKSCLDYIDKTWKDMRPLSLRKKLEQMDGGPVVKEIDSSEEVESLVDLLCKKRHIIQIPERLRTKEEIDAMIKNKLILVQIMSVNGAPRISMKPEEVFYPNSSNIEIRCSFELDLVPLQSDLSLSLYSFEGTVTVEKHKMEINK